jgi:hypothetical protein
LEKTDVSEVRTTSIIRVMTAVRTSETLVYSSETTWRYVPEGYLNTRRRENLKTHAMTLVSTKAVNCLSPQLISGL